MQKPGYYSLNLLCDGTRLLEIMKKPIAVCLLCLISIGLMGQSLDDLSFGTDSTFDLMTWNIQTFPKDGQRTLDSVSQIIEALDIDLIALQEINDLASFDQLTSALQGWEGIYIDQDHAGLSYLYKPAEIEVLDTFLIYPVLGREFPRAPLVIEIRYRGERFLVINNHLKCCGDGFIDNGDPWDEETRRLDASNLLDQYLKTYVPDDPVILLGDLNDVLTDAQERNVFEAFINDESNYLFADMDIALSSHYNWSYPWYPSHLDHILLTSEVFNRFASSAIDVQTIKVDKFMAGGMQAYDNMMTDHRPVAMKINTAKLATGLRESKRPVREFRCYPNPFLGTTTFSFDPASRGSSLEIYTMDGRQVGILPLEPGQTRLTWDARSMDHSIYFAKLRDSSGNTSILKMALIR